MNRGVVALLLSSSLLLGVELGEQFYLETEISSVLGIPDLAYALLAAVAIGLVATLVALLLKQSRSRQEMKNVIYSAMAGIFLASFFYVVFGADYDLEGTDVGPGAAVLNGIILSTAAGVGGIMGAGISNPVAGATRSVKMGIKSRSKSIRDTVPSVPSNSRSSNSGGSPPESLETHYGQYLNEELAPDPHEVMAECTGSGFPDSLYPTVWEIKLSPEPYIEEELTFLLYDTTTEVHEFPSTTSVETVERQGKIEPVDESAEGIDLSTFEPADHVTTDVETDACSTCSTGEYCKECDNTGAISCPESKCTNGVIYVSCECRTGDITTTCGKCGGDGKYVCETCNASGSIYRNGTERRCPNCAKGNRSNKKGYARCEQCEGVGEITETCTQCGGSSRKRVDSCSVCIPQHEYPDGEIECQECAGGTEVPTCPDCDGTQEILRITQERKTKTIKQHSDAKKPIAQRKRGAPEPRGWNETKTFKLSGENIQTFIESNRKSASDILDHRGLAYHQMSFDPDAEIDDPDGCLFHPQHIWERNIDNPEAIHAVRQHIRISHGLTVKAQIPNKNLGPELQPEADYRSSKKIRIIVVNHGDDWETFVPNTPEGQLEWEDGKLRVPEPSG